MPPLPLHRPRLQATRARIRQPGQQLERAQHHESLVGTVPVFLAFRGIDDSHAQPATRRVFDIAQTHAHGRRIAAKRGHR